MSLDYTPPPTLREFMLSNALVRCVVGPLGSGKSMACIMELLRRACEQHPKQEGKKQVRFSRFAIVRNTLQQLRATVLEDIRQYLGPIMAYYVTDSTVRIRIPLPDGTEVSSDWLLIPLDTKEDVKRLLSLQLTGAWINECREVPFEIIRPLVGRTGRYPSKKNGGFTWRGLIMDTNPWDVDSAYHDRFVLNPKKKWELYHQPSGIGPNAENVENLPPDYYEDLLDGKDEGWQEVHVESQFGESNAGQAVFRRSFNAKVHVVDMNNPQVNPHRPLIIGLDFGRTPTALIGQVDSLGRLVVYKEVVTKDMGIHQMLDEQLKPVLFQEPFQGKRFFVVADPAGIEKTQVSDESPFDSLKEHGFLAHPAPTNKIERRLGAVEKLFRTQVNGGPGIVISRQGCPTLIHALGSKYMYKKKRDGNTEEVPDKTHPWSDVADALQYMCLGVNSNLTGRVLMRDMRKGSQFGRAPVPSKGWT